MKTSEQANRAIAKALYQISPHDLDLHALCTFGDNQSPENIIWAKDILVDAVKAMVEDPDFLEG